MELESGLFAYPWQGEGNNCNTYAIGYQVNGESRFALVDPGLRKVQNPMMDPRTGRVVQVHEEPGFERLARALSADGIAEPVVGLVIITHAHHDHCDAGPLLQRKGARLALHPADEPQYMKLVSAGYRDQSEGLEPDIRLREGEIWLGKPPRVCLQVLSTPGHSPGSVSLYWADKKAIFCGDVVFYRSVGRTDFPGGSTSLLQESVQRLASLDAEYLLTGHPYGHPGVIQGREAVRQNFELILRHVFP